MYSCAVIPPASSAIEGEKNVAKSWSLFGSHLSQGFATAVTLSYSHHYSLSTVTKSARLSMVPTVQISPRRYQIYLYDCLQDVMFANIFFFGLGSVWNIYGRCFITICFFPTKLDSNLVTRVNKFGDEKSPGFNVNRAELLFGLSLNRHIFNGLSRRKAEWYHNTADLNINCRCLYGISFSQLTYIAAPGLHADLCMHCYENRGLNIITF